MSSSTSTLGHLLVEQSTGRSGNKLEANVEKNKGADAKNAVAVNHANPTTTQKVKIPPAEIIQKNCLPSDIFRSIIRDVSDNKDAARFLVCRGLYHDGQVIIDEERKLAHHAIFDPTPENRAKLIAMLEAKPELLKTKIRYSQDQSGRVFENKTVFQLICGAGDEAYYLAMQPAFLTLCKNDKDAIAEMERQRQEMRGKPEDSEEEKKKKAEKEAKSKELLENELKLVIAAIGAERFNHGKDDKGRWKLNPDTTLPAIHRFREEYKKIKPREGMHFRYDSFAEALAQYAAAAPGWNYDYKKCALFEDAVLSTIESDFPVNDACKAAQGLYYLQKEDEPEACKHSLTLRNGIDNFYEIVRGPSQLFDLPGCYVDIRRGHAGGGLALGAAAAAARQAHFQFLCQTKTSSFQSGTDRLKPEPKSQLVAG